MAVRTIWNHYYALCNFTVVLVVTLGSPWMTSMMYQRTKDPTNRTSVEVRLLGYIFNKTCLACYIVRLFLCLHRFYGYDSDLLNTGSHVTINRFINLYKDRVNYFTYCPYCIINSKIYHDHDNLPFQLITFRQFCTREQYRLFAEIPLIQNNDLNIVVQSSVFHGVLKTIKQFKVQTF